jgi:hypothetical protein
VVATNDASAVVVVAVTGASPDLELVDLLARLQLAARRLGGSVVLRDPGDGLRELLVLAGLAEVLPLEAGRQAEGGEELRVEEVVQPGDPIA